MKAFSLPQALFSEETRAAIAWEPFREGVEISWVYRTDDPLGPAAAFLRYEPGATVPRHNHRGFEHIFMLEGAQTDENGRYEAGDVVINPPDTQHSIVSEEGCVVLAVWQKPVEFVDPTS